MKISQLKELYLSEINDDMGGEPERWWEAVARCVSRIQDAPTQDAAAKVAAEAGWNEPDRCARIVRGWKIPDNQIPLF